MEQEAKNTLALDGEKLFHRLTLLSFAAFYCSLIGCGTFSPSLLDVLTAREFGVFFWTLLSLRVKQSLAEIQFEDFGV